MSGSQRGKEAGGWGPWPRGAGGALAASAAAGTPVLVPVPSPTELTALE